MADLINIDALADAILERLRPELHKLVNIQPDKQPAARNEQKYLSRKEVSELLGITLPTLGEWVKQGKIPAHRIGRRVRFKQNEVDKALKKIDVGQ